MTKPKEVFICKYNIGVSCDAPYDANCRRCGWNPTMAMIRINKLRARFAEERAAIEE